MKNTIYSRLLPSLPASKAGVGNFVLLRADNIRLLFPESQIGVPEYLQDNLSVVDGADGMGLFCVNNEKNGHVYMALSDQIQILKEPPVNRSVVTPIRSAEGGEVRWCWSEVKNISQHSVYLQTLAPAMLVSDTLVSHFAEVDGNLAFLCDAGQLLHHALAESGGMLL